MTVHLVRASTSDNTDPVATSDTFVDQLSALTDHAITLDRTYQAAGFAATSPIRVGLAQLQTALLGAELTAITVRDATVEAAATAALTEASTACHG